jgi:hypothetical protein
MIQDVTLYIDKSVGEACGMGTILAEKKHDKNNTIQYNNTLLAQAMDSCHNNTIQSWGRVHTQEGEVEWADILIIRISNFRRNPFVTVECINVIIVCASLTVFPSHHITMNIVNLS